MIDNANNSNRFNNQLFRIYMLTQGINTKKIFHYEKFKRKYTDASRDGFIIFLSEKVQ